MFFYPSDVWNGRFLREMRQNGLGAEFKNGKAMTRNMG
jgi:hypothetical protein